jgi:hypothetical protein
VCDSYKGASARVGAIFRAREASADGIELASIFEHSQERCGHKWASNLSKTQVHAGNPSSLLGHTCIHSIKTSMPVTATMTIDFDLMSFSRTFPNPSLPSGNTRAG